MTPLLPQCLYKPLRLHESDSPSRGCPTAPTTITPHQEGAQQLYTTATLSKDPNKATFMCNNGGRSLDGNTSSFRTCFLSIIQSYISPSSDPDLSIRRCPWVQSPRILHFKYQRSTHRRYSQPQDSVLLVLLTVNLEGSKFPSATKFKCCPKTSIDLVFLNLIVTTETTKTNI